MQRVEHEIHRRRLSRNLGVGLLLVALVAVIFGLTIAQIELGEPLEGYDHVTSPTLEGQR